MIDHGLTGPSLGGLLDRQKDRWLCFDLDGTRQTVIERAVPDNRTYGPAVRRRSVACAAGYVGRKRGDAVRTRLTVQQAHTSEWLGSFSAAGNGLTELLVDPALAMITTYLRARNWDPARALLRFDGEHGYEPNITRLLRSGLGFLVRCALYRWLADPAVTAVLEAGTYVSLEHTDTGTVRQIFDVPKVLWVVGDVSTAVRLVVTRRRHDATRPVRIGKLLGEWIYEIFVTSVDPAALAAADVVTMYLHRGSFEATLAQEDREVPTDRWITNAPDGEDLWQVVTQWVWNLTLWLGHRQQAEPLASVRQTDFTPTVETLAELARVSPVTVPPASTTDTEPAPNAEPSAEPELTWAEPSEWHAESALPREPEPSDPCTEPSDEAMESSDSLAPSSSVDPPNSLRFVRQSEGHVKCPVGVSMRRVELRRIGKRIRERFQTPPRACLECVERTRCRGPKADLSQGRRVDLALGQAWVEVMTESTRARTRAPRLEVLSAVDVGVPSSAQGKRGKQDKRGKAASPSTAQVDPAKPSVPEIQARPTTAPSESTRIVWMDVCACALRTGLVKALTDLKVEVEWTAVPPPPEQPPDERLIHRDVRAKRRHTWDWALQRNRRNPYAPRVRLQIRGLAEPLIKYLGIPAPG